MSTEKNDGPPQKVFTESEVKVILEGILFSVDSLSKFFIPNIAARHGITL